MTRRLLVLAFLVPALAHAVPPAPVGDIDPPRRLRVNAGHAKRFADAFGVRYDKVHGATKQDVVAFDRALVPALHKHPDKRGADVAKKLDRYISQIVVYEKAGERRLYANFACADDGFARQRWMAEPITVDDGGACYFQVDFSITDGRVVDISINGDA